ncbi:MAG: hypothetical protein Ct9H300mP14_05700 [Gammaproteobacteria bacterium]|nr:MAG: hypothetical protein Ct9H300mP14_05700 [Gammaproteobacteria bacterium]
MVTAVTTDCAACSATWDPGDSCALRLGIGHPGNSDEVTDYVLRIPSAQDRELILEAVQRSARLLEDMAAGDWERVMNELHKGPNRIDD